LTYSSNKSFEHNFSKVFNVLNPNLDPSIENTYELSPMLDEEAREALDLSLDQCKSYNVND
jgi:hypothetical protein